MRRSRRSGQRAVRHREEHTHDDSCYTTEQVLICALPEHEHTLECLADYSADVETEDDWEKNSDNLSSAWYGNPYGDWDVMFVAFCQHYAGIPRDAIPQRAGLFALRTDLETINPDYLVDGCEDVIPGDVVTYYNRDGDETSGLSCCGRLADGCGGTPAGIQAQKAAVNHSYAQKGSCTESCAGPFFVANHQKTSAVKFPNAGNKLRMLL